jgi:hypothetical protein
MTCPTCGAEVDSSRAFCIACGAELRPALVARPAGAGYSDVQTVDLARVPAEMRAPTTWTVAKGVFLGLLLWTLFSAVLAMAVWALVQA